MRFSVCVGVFFIPLTRVTRFGYAGTFILTRIGNGFSIGQKILFAAEFTFPVDALPNPLTTYSLDTGTASPLDELDDVLRSIRTRGFVPIVQWWRGNNAGGIIIFWFAFLGDVSTFLTTHIRNKALGRCSSHQLSSTQTVGTFPTFGKPATRTSSGLASVPEHEIETRSVGTSRFVFRRRTSGRRRSRGGWSRGLGGGGRRRR